MGLLSILKKVKEKEREMRLLTLCARVRACMRLCLHLSLVACVVGLGLERRSAFLRFFLGCYENSIHKRDALQFFIATLEPTLICLHFVPSPSDPIPPMGGGLSPWSFLPPVRTPDLGSFGSPS